LLRVEFLSNHIVISFSTLARTRTPVSGVRHCSECRRTSLRGRAEERHCEAERKNVIARQSRRTSLRGRAEETSLRGRAEAMLRVEFLSNHIVISFSTLARTRIRVSGVRHCSECRRTSLRGRAEETSLRGRAEAMLRVEFLSNHFVISFSTLARTRTRVSGVRHCSECRRTSLRGPMGQSNIARQSRRTSLRAEPKDVIARPYGRSKKGTAKKLSPKV
jgi:hypothetical protein